MWITVAVQDWNKVAEAAGVYAIYKNGTLRYVGSTTNLRGRLYGHCRRLGLCGDYGYVPESNHYAKVSFSKREGDWLMRELRLIQKLKPAWNKNHTGRRQAPGLAKWRKRPRVTLLPCYRTDGPG
jgi:hypothetical protein